MARNEQLIRQHRIVHILERYRYGRTLEEIRDEVVDELGLTSLHPRSIRRDIEALQTAGMDIVSEQVERGKVWKLGKLAKASHQITATAAELMALSLGRDLLLPLAGTPFWIGIESFWSKIQASLPAGVSEHYERYREMLHVIGTPAKDYRQHDGMIKTINRAIQEHRVVEAEYQGLRSRKFEVRQIAPYGVVLYRSSLYIVADACDRQDANPIRHFKLDRFRKATALDKWFKPRPDFDLEAHLRKSLGVFAGQAAETYRIHISAYAAPWVLEDPWHRDQVVEPLEDGSLVLTVQAGHQLDVIPRVLALGAEAEVLEPTGCRAELAAIAEQLWERYRADPRAS